MKILQLQIISLLPLHAEGRGHLGATGSPSPAGRGVGWRMRWGRQPFTACHALEEGRGEKRKATKVLNPTKIYLLEGWPSSLQACAQRETGLVAKAQD